MDEFQKNLLELMERWVIVQEEKHASYQKRPDVAEDFTKEQLKAGLEVLEGARDEVTINQFKFLLLQRGVNFGPYEIHGYVNALVKEYPEIELRVNAKGWRYVSIPSKRR